MRTTKTLYHDLHEPYKRGDVLRFHGYDEHYVCRMEHTDELSWVYRLQERDIRVKTPRVNGDYADIFAEVALVERLKKAGVQPDFTPEWYKEAHDKINELRAALQVPVMAVRGGVDIRCVELEASGVLQRYMTDQHEGIATPLMVCYDYERKHYAAYAYVFALVVAYENVASMFYNAVDEAMEQERDPLAAFRYAYHKLGLQMRQMLNLEANNG
jgi:hypothetical protein